MTGPTESYREVPYDLRPKKQVERRMFVDALQRLSVAGFPISEYKYTGLGSIHFVDFILFHRLLGITDLLSVEHSESITKRIHFNRPYKKVDVKISKIGDVIPTLSRDKKHIIWLDYDDILHKEQLEDVELCGTFLPVGSIVVITIDAHPPKGDGPKQWRKHFMREAGRYLGTTTKVSDFWLSKLVKRNAEVLYGALIQGMAGRDALFFPMFKFLYADGRHPMLTVGGMVVGEEEKRKLAGSSLIQTVYFRPDATDQPYEIKMPTLTRKERLHLDCEMPCADGWVPRDFELTAEEVRDYRDIYRFYPAYAELLL
jgi:hypothetical protein